MNKSINKNKELECLQISDEDFINAVDSNITSIVGESDQNFGDFQSVIDETSRDSVTVQSLNFEDHDEPIEASADDHRSPYVFFHNYVRSSFSNNS